METFGIYAGWGLSLVIYGIPTFVREHHNRAAILALNLLLGWTIIGWSGTLVWSLTNPPKA